MASTGGLSCELRHHGVAACSNRNAVTWIRGQQEQEEEQEESEEPSSSRPAKPSISSSSTTTTTTTTRRINDGLVYSSHAIINVAYQQSAGDLLMNNKNDDGIMPVVQVEEENIWNVQQTLRTQLLEEHQQQQSVSTDGATVVITTLCNIVVPNKGIVLPGGQVDGTYLASGFSNGSINVWMNCSSSSTSLSWKESILVSPSSNNNTSSTNTGFDQGGRSITVLKGIWFNSTTMLLVSGTSAGACLYQCGCSTNSSTNNTINTTSEALPPPQQIQIQAIITLLDNTAVFAIHIIQQDMDDDDDNNNTIMIFIGTASPRHNKIHIYSIEQRESSLSAATTSTTQSNTNNQPVGNKNNNPKQHQEIFPLPVILQPRYVGYLLGHEDWISGFDWCSSRIPSIPLRYEDNVESTTTTTTATAAITRTKVGMLASASQDCKIRLWKFTTTTPTTTSISLSNDDTTMEGGNTIIPTIENVIANVEVEEEQDDEGESRLQIIHTHGHQVTNVMLDALLIGHEDHITSIQWHPNPKPLYGQDLLLISSSMDRSILFWAPGMDDIWTPIARVGSAGGILGGSVGSTLFGYCHASLNPSTGTILIGHAYGGALHFWSILDNDPSLYHRTITKNHPQQQQQPTTADVSTIMTIEQRTAFVLWKATPCITGHFNGVTDLSWETETGQYLLTVGLDQTCRLWAPIATTNPQRESIWVELARPQVHGYDLYAVTSLSDRTRPHMMLSGADEKEIRVFDAPKTTLRMLQVTCSGSIQSVDPIERVERAYIPSLGLSNKASATDGAVEADYTDLNGKRMDETSMEMIRLPRERDLGAVSLWPEVLKLFGHNTELYCLASTLSARTAPERHHIEQIQYSVPLVASSGKARDMDAAAIRIWNVYEGSCVQVLSGGHKSTIASMAFSPDGQYLVSSGKDRRICLWKRTNQQLCPFELLWAKDSAHKRIVWSVHFCPFVSTILASGSRDGCIKIWQIEDGGSSSSSMVNVRLMYSFAPTFRTKDQKPDSVTALSFAPIPALDGNMILAVGLESGRIEFWSISVDTNIEPHLTLALHPSICHVATIRKLAWKPMLCGGSEMEEKRILYLASCSMDHGCRIYKVTME